MGLRARHPAHADSPADTFQVETHTKPTTTENQMELFPPPGYPGQDPARRATAEFYAQIAQSARPGYILPGLNCDTRAHRDAALVCFQGLAYLAATFEFGQCPYEESLIDTAHTPAKRIAQEVRDALGHRIFVIPVLGLPDMGRDPDLETRLSYRRVRVLWGTADLAEDLVEIARTDQIFEPPSAAQSQEVLGIYRQRGAVSNPEAKPHEDGAPVELGDRRLIVRPGAGFTISVREDGSALLTPG